MRLNQNCHSNTGFGNITPKSAAPEITLFDDVPVKRLSAFSLMSGLDGHNKKIAKQMLLNVVPKNDLL